MTGKWIRRDVDIHRCDKPVRWSDAPRARIGDLWQCDSCSTVWEVTGFDSGMQWDPFPTVIVWKKKVVQNPRII